MAASRGAEVKGLLDWLTNHGRFAAPRDFVIELGANIGTSTIPIAQHTGCRVVAVESVPEIFAVLCRNVADNGLAPRVTCVQAAISTAVSGRLQMIMPGDKGGGSEISRLDREPSFAGQLRIRGTVEVPALALGDLLDAHGVAPERIAFVWSDTQGCEAGDRNRYSPLCSGRPAIRGIRPDGVGGPEGAAALVAAATARFAGFIPADTLVADAAARPGRSPNWRISAAGSAQRAPMSYCCRKCSSADQKPVRGRASAVVT